MNVSRLRFLLIPLYSVLFLGASISGSDTGSLAFAQPTGTGPLYVQGPPMRPPENDAPTGGKPPADATPQPPASPPVPENVPPSGGEDDTSQAPVEPSDATKALQTPEDQPPAVTTSETDAAQVLKGPSRLQVEITESYAHFSSNQLFIDGFGIIPILAVGDIRIERVRRDIFSTQVSARYRMTNRLQFDIRIPYTVVFSRVSGVKDNTLVPDAPVGPNEERFAKSAGLGDLEGSLSYQLLNEKVGRPGILVGLGVRLRTGRDFFETTDPTEDPPLGSAYNGIIGTVSLVKTADPAVLFGSMSFVYAVPRNDVLFNNAGNLSIVDFDPGNSIRWGMGVAYALNFRLNLSLQFSQAITFPTRIDGNKNPNSFANALSMRIGGVWRFNDLTSIDVGVSPGFSLDAPDVRFDIRVPYRF